MIAADASRENARTPDGRFGPQATLEATAVDLVEPADVDEALEWWFEDGSFAITTAAVDRIGGCDEGWQGWGDKGTSNNVHVREIVAESKAAAAAILDACEPFDRHVSHGTSGGVEAEIGEVIRIPLMSTSEDEETAAHFAQSGSENGVGAVWEFPQGAVGVRVPLTQYEVEWVVTGDYRYTDRYTDGDGVEHYVLVPA